MNARIERARAHPPAFKAMVALAALRGQDSEALATRHGLRADQVVAWKHEVLSRAPELFRGDAASRDRAVVLKVVELRLGWLHWRMVLWKAPPRAS